MDEIKIIEKKFKIYKPGEPLPSGYVYDENAYNETKNSDYVKELMEQYMLPLTFGAPESSDIKKLLTTIDPKEVIGRIISWDNGEITVRFREDEAAKPILEKIDKLNISFAHHVFIGVNLIKDVKYTILRSSLGSILVNPTLKNRKIQRDKL